MYGDRIILLEDFRRTSHEMAAGDWFRSSRPNPYEYDKVLCVLSRVLLKKCLRAIVNMAEVSTVVVAVSGKGESQSQKTKKAAAAPKKPKAKATHPPTSEMVTNAIKMLKERGGSSLPAIKKYLAGNYKVDVDRLAPFIKKYLKSAVTNGALIQTKGKGAAGSFKLSKSVAKPKPKVKSIEAKEKKPAASKKVTKKPKKEKAAVGDSKKQPASTKKVEKKKTAKAVAKTVKKTGEVKSKTPKQKPTKPTKTAAKSPKAAKPKVATAAKKGAAKKVAKK